MMIIVKYSVKKLVIGIAREMELPVALATESLCTDYRKCDLFHSPITRPDETDGQSVIHNAASVGGLHKINVYRQVEVSL